MTWAEEFARGYDEWTAGVTDDIDFYVGLAVEAAGPVVELAIGSGRGPCRSLWRRVDRSSVWTLRRPCSNRRDAAPTKRVSS